MLLCPLFPQFKRVVLRCTGRMTDAVNDHLYITCEGALMIAGEKACPIRDVSIRDSAFTWKQQGALVPDCLDEQPSRRGVYSYDVPTAYIRCGENISIRDSVRYTIDESMKAYIRESFVSE